MANPHHYGIVAPGLRDNDWAHAAYDDVWYAAEVGRRRPASAMASAVGVDPVAGDPAGEAIERSTGIE